MMSPEINISLSGEALLHWEKKRESKGHPGERRGAGASCTAFTARLPDPDPSQAALLKLSLLELCLYTIRVLGNTYGCNVCDKTNDTHTLCFRDVPMINGDETLQKINYLITRMRKATSVVTFCLVLRAFVPTHETEISFHSTQEAAAPQRRHSQAHSFHLYLSGSLLRAVPEPSSPRRQHPELSCPVGGRQGTQIRGMGTPARLSTAAHMCPDCTNHIHTANVFLTASAKLAEGTTQ